MLRFAQSPTGDMHIGNLRVAIINYILSKKLNEELLVRIDDTEKEKNIEGKEKEILEILSLFSIEHSRVAYQSESLKYHQKLAMQLMAQKKAFACFCSDEKLEELRVELEKEGKPFAYDGFCATLSDETVLNCNAPFVVRIKKPEKNITFTDTLKGELTFKPEEVDSFVILKHDKTATYDYACALDDMIYNTSLVVRDEKFTSNTPKQIFLREALNYDKKIDYIHLPTILNADEFPVNSLINEGFLPSAIANYLVYISIDAPKEIFTLEETIEWFEISNILNKKIEFDIEKLKEINKKHLEQIDNMRLSKILGFADEDLGKLAKLYLNESSTIKELKSKIDLIFSSKPEYKGFNEEFKKIKECMKTAPFFNQLEELEKYISDNTGLKDESLSKPLKYILTSREDGPEIFDIYPLIKNYIGEIVK